MICFLMRDAIIISNLSVLKELDDNQLRNRFKDTVQPLITIAGNNGFEGLRWLEI